MVNSVDLKDGFLFSFCLFFFDSSAEYLPLSASAFCLSFFGGKEGVLSIVLCRV